MIPSDVSGPSITYLVPGITVCKTLAVLYTAFFVPVQLSIWSSDNVCHSYPLLTLDIFVDCWFMFEFLLRGFVGEYMEGKYVDDFWHLLLCRTLDYGRTTIDVISAFPFTVVGYSLMMVCDQSPLFLAFFNHLTLWNPFFTEHVQWV